MQNESTKHTDELKYKIFEKNNERNLANRSHSSAIIKSYSVQIAITSVLIMLSILSYTESIKLFEKKPAHFDFLFFAAGLSLLLISVWVVSIKRRDLHVEKLNGLTNKELDAYLVRITNKTEEHKRMTASSLYNAFLIILVFTYLIINGAKSFDVGRVTFLGEKLTREGILVSTLFVIYVLISQVLVLLFSPMLRRRSRKKKLFDQVNLSFLTCIDDSPLNPTNN